MRRGGFALTAAVLAGAGLYPLLAIEHAVASSVMASRSANAGADIDLSAIDQTADACQDFYQHACGGFIARAKLTPGHPEANLAEEEFDANLEAGLQSLFSIKAPETSELGRLETFHASCLSDDPSNVQTIKRWLARIDAARSPADIQKLLRALSAIGVDPFFSYSGQPDPTRLQKYRGEIDLNNLWQEPAVVERTFVLAGMPAAQAKADAGKVAEIATELGKHQVRSDKAADYENPRTLTQLEATAPALDWARYFKMVGASPGRPINVTSASYLPAVSHELATRAPSDLRAYLRWVFLFSLRGELPRPYNEAFGDLTPSLRVDVNDPAKRCRDATVRALGVEFSRQYSERILGLPARAAAAEIASSIRDGIVKSVDQAEWLSAEARGKTADKLRQTDLKVGFPDHWPAVGSFPLSRHDFMGNVLRAREYEAHRAWNRANLPRSRADWDMLVAPWVGTGMAAARLVVPNGFPDPYSNSLIMTAAFLASPRFDVSAAPELNYASFGAVFAHEFVHIAETHDFAADGRQEEIWSAADIAAAKKQHQCVIDQANAYPAPPGARISGESNYSENVADLGGLRLAYEALAAKLGKSLNQPDASGMTPAKRFFYKYAQNYCTAATPDVLRKLARDDSHGLPSYRVNGPLSNLREFGETFGCKEGSPMRRPAANICRVW
jgi:putative endopeptidase